ncbi:MAG: RNA methyltransferase [Chloroflexota bacterium]
MKPMFEHQKIQPQNQDKAYTGYFGIGIYQVKTTQNIGLLWRAAYQLGAAYIFTIGNRYKPQNSDVFKSWMHIPIFTYDSFEQMQHTAAYGCPLVGIEMGGTPLPEFQHPSRAVYLLGAEDSGIPNAVQEQCHHVVSIPAMRTPSYNVSHAGVLVMYDRMVKMG